MASDLMVLNDYGLTRRDRTLKSGAKRSRYYTEIKAEPLVVNTDPKSLTRAPAIAMAEHLRTRVQSITATASPATIAADKVAAKAYAEGKPWAVRQFSGGKIGPMAPSQGGSRSLFNNSGRFARSIAVGATKDGWIINIAANRLDPTTLNGGEAGLVRLVEKLRQYVPEWGDAAAMANVLPVQRAIRDAQKALVQKVAAANAETWKLRLDLIQASLDIVDQAAG